MNLNKFKLKTRHQALIAIFLTDKPVNKNSRVQTQIELLSIFQSTLFYTLHFHYDYFWFKSSETTFEDAAIIGGSNGILFVVGETAYDKLKILSATGTISIKELLKNGVIAKGKGFVIALGSDLIDATATVSVSGDAEGTKTVIKAEGYSADNSTSAISISQITVKPITLASPS